MAEGETCNRRVRFWWGISGICFLEVKILSCLLHFLEASCCSRSQLWRGNSHVAALSKPNRNKWVSQLRDGQLWFDFYSAELLQATLDT